MKRLLAVLLVGCLVVGGCLGAGTASDLLSYDNIAVAAQEARKGVTALDTAVQADTAKGQVAMLEALRQSIVQSGGAADQADRIVAAMKVHLANYAEQDRRRQMVVGATQDNLDFILELCEKGKQFTLYRASVSEQWKAYLAATANDVRRVEP
jgi:hypothetical protein